MVKKIFPAVLSLLIAAAATAHAQLPTDTVKTGKGDLKITFLGYGSLLFQFKGKNIYVDPVSKWADYTRLPKADLILVTHNMTTHLDTKAIFTLRTSRTEVVLCDSCSSAERDGLVMQNGDERTMQGIKVEGVQYQRRAGGRSQPAISLPFEGRGERVRPYLCG
jgi:L-ascorbate metabolism protein UlaG (beta-lactamase superfamily)